MRALACVLAAAGLLAGGCGGAVATPSPTPQPTTSPTSVPVTPVPATNSDGAVQIRLVGDAPVLRAPELGDGHYTYVMPAAYFVDGETRHAYFVGFGEARGDQKVFHATSADGIDWTIDPADPFADLGLNLSPPGPIPTSVVQIDGTWVMYLWGVPAPQFDQSAIWRATADDPGGPWSADSHPVLRPGVAGEWDDRGLDFPAVTTTPSGYLMFYSASGGPEPNIARIGRATSADGVTWQPGTEPIAEKGLCPFDTRYVAQPRILTSGRVVRVLYDTERHLGAAAADPDGSNWRCISDRPLLSGDDIPGSQGIHTEAATQTTSGFSLLLESLVEGASELWLAEATILD